MPPAGFSCFCAGDEAWGSWALTIALASFVDFPFLRDFSTVLTDFCLVETELSGTSMGVFPIDLFWKTVVLVDILGEIQTKLHDY